MYGLNSLPLIPVCVDPDHRSEMISQLIFGEYVIVNHQQDGWCNVTNLQDSCTGWVDGKMIKIVSEAEYQKAMKQECFPLFRPYNIIYNIRLNQTRLIPGGSLIYGLDGDEFKIGSEKWSLIEPIEKPVLPYPVHHLLEIAVDFMNAPFLLGGKSILGIDCSGFVQLVFAISGYKLPRFAAEQVETGLTVDFLTESLPGDLAFFEDSEGKINHVGILIDNSKIVHVSGCVKTENIDSQGIISNTGEYTHQLRVIKRIIK